MGGCERGEVSRRQFIRTAAGVGAAMLTGPRVSWAGRAQEPRAHKRELGRTGFRVTTLGLGGQASLQWTPEDVDPVDIIIKAYQQGVNYFDTSNAYAQSQRHYGTAFRRLGLTAGHSNYDERARRGVFVASKTCIRSGRGRYPDTQNWTQGPRDSTCVDDLKRSMTQIWGNGKGDYPDGAYLDLFQVHSLNTFREVDAIYEGLDDPDPDAERIGTLVTLLDYRDGTNRTGLNPKHEKLIRHIGVSGHLSSPTLMECLQRDDRGIFGTVLTVANANDRRYFNHQHNVIPVAAAKGLGVISMKVFADGAFYDKGAHWTRGPQEVVRRVGSPELPSAPLIRYPLSVPGVCLNIIGIGHIDEDPSRCQLQQNLRASQLPEPLSASRMGEIEQMAATAKDGETNYFQKEAEPLGAPRNVTLEQRAEGPRRTVSLSWDTAYAADTPILHYEVRRDGASLARVDHEPQTTREPFRFEDRPEDRTGHAYTVVTVDAGGRRTPSEVLVAEPV
ncbi:MAG: aldo/keto reductase [Candidatus Brocadiia bacterium]